MKLALAALALLLVNEGRVALQPDHRTDPQPQPIVDNSDFMALLQRPAYTELQEALATPPADRRRWAVVYERAVRLAELQNLLFIRSRTGADDPRWRQAAAASRAAAADVASAALVGLRDASVADYDGVKTKFASIAGACNSCHRTFSREAPTIRASW